MRQLAVLALVFAALAAAPLLIASEATLNIVIMTLYAALLGQAWNILGGYGGQFSFGHAAFFGTGAYTVAVLQVQFGLNPWLGLAAGGAVAVAVAAFIGFATFRYGLRGSYFALVTLAFAEVLRILANSVPFTGAGVGILIPLNQSATNLQFASKTGYFWLIWAMALAAFLVAWWIGHSRFGARLMAVRDNEDAARALGVDPFAVKMRAIMLSGLFSGLAGVFYAQYFLYLDPALAYGPAISVESLLVPIIGGMGTLFGPLLGAAALHLLSEVTRELIGDLPGISLVLYGTILILMVLFVPRGLAGLIAPLARRFSARRKETGHA
ncbi:branched-chain amino acid ABC transporter permease [Polymorphum gilvum]|uniref:Putative branched-chain amino acid ABC transporter (Permease protein) livM-like protein n=1 Tax=Polymorphum gilvum (strain LMG 25793 / CGMCC 1.9160 / SL003B-26A1) TaxID=991905 RepID=F2J4K4_POLGS|nr:branched-chain amino acid ABC transporter permease [Polymorphum gilvum]ADZ72256.1 Putative branched-chain amino acid ABC transporter (Permease protein); livM-like protein [Polymorphum gilvum SL003B-26A1]